MRPGIIPCAALAAVLLLLSACAGAASRVSALEAAVGSAPEAAYAGLPPISSLHQGSDIDPFYVDVAHLASYGGEAEVLAPDRIALGTAASGGSGVFSYALYDQELSNFTANDLHFQIDPAESLNGQPGSYMIALAHFESQRWEWYGPFSDASGSIVLPGQQGYASGWGHAVFAVVPRLGFGCTVNLLQMSAALQPDQQPPTGDDVITVGPGRDFSNLMDALAAAGSGPATTDIVVYPNAGNQPYAMTALFVTRPNLRFWGVRTEDNQRPILDGSGFDYSGVGSIPRAIFQFQPGADNCEVHGFELRAAHNSSYNGAGIRVNQAKACQVTDCVIHSCDMGVMSNGDAVLQSGQLVLSGCQIHSNGNLEDPGYNHNIYAGGYELYMLGCEVYGSLTGHNVKSRAFINVLDACFIHDSANRELDLVDAAGVTDLPGCHSRVIGCVIRKAPGMEGNRAVIHYGQDGGGDRDGPLYLVNNTIITPYTSPVIQLSGANSDAVLYSNLVWDGGADVPGQQIAAAISSGNIARISGRLNWFSGGFSIPAGGALDDNNNYFALESEEPPFTDPAAGDYRLLPGNHANLSKAGLSFLDFFPTPTDGNGNPVSIFPAHAYRAPFSWFVRIMDSEEFDIGAYQTP
ncbi:hypothetical protein IT575_05015 [bacterium]|nr:hypothetical protein [bacterium]